MYILLSMMYNQNSMVSHVQNTLSNQLMICNIMFLKIKVIVTMYSVV